ncbi:MAG: nicotinate (nicotinamide) nucleotide adenylyltransferase [Clostridia bacterium]|nr:nicotinate (nicotinamide) nucleotide adenylyltransferase [Clostridia bacterium]
MHNGHVAAAKAFMEQMWLDILYIMPAGIPPHKQLKGDANAWQRLRMCELAFEGMDGVIISDLEIRREGKSYTVDTLRALASPEHRLFLMMGTDMLLTLDQWREPEQIFKLCYPVYMRREASDPILDAKIVTKIAEYQEKYGKVVRRITGDVVPVSSTMIRETIDRGEDISDMVPDAVEKYIREQGLYKLTGGVAQ